MINDKPNSSIIINILYCIKTNKHAGPSFPNQYDLGVIAVSNVLTKISTLQINYAEIFSNKEYAIRNRLLGLFDGHEICFIDSLEEIKEKPNALKVLFSDIIPAENEIDKGTLVVITDDSLPESEKYLHFKSLTPKIFRSKALNFIDSLSNDKKIILHELKEYFGFEAEYGELNLQTTVQNGFYNRINLAVLESLRVKVQQNGISSNFNTDEIEWLLNLIIKIRIEISREIGTKNYSPAVQLYFSDTSSSFEFDKNKKNLAALFKKYAEFDPKIVKEAFNFASRGLIADGIPKTRLIEEIEQERLLLDSLIVLSASNNVSPVVKLPLSNNGAFQQIMKLATSDRYKERKTNALMKQVREAFSQYIDNWLEYANKSPSLSIKLVSNFPLEWTHHQGLPLMVRHEVSRIPATPGYVTTKLLLDSKVIKLSPNSFKEILFISSFEDDDPIKDHVKEKLDIIQKDLTSRYSAFIERLKENGSIPSSYEDKDETKPIDIRFKWVDVSNVEELIEAINNNHCAVTVFDLHGGHKIDGGGCIYIKGNPIYTSYLIGKIEISPIVILSTCDASPIDKGHESTAEAFFLAGAKTVISSALPINSHLASTFLARLLIRLQSYLPEALTHNPMVRWSTLVSGMIRRTYYHELLTLLQKEYKFSSDTKTELLFRIGIKIDPLHPDWVAIAEREITSMLKIDINELRQFVASNVQFVECMKYFQLGRPELVVIFPSDEPFSA